MSWTIIFQTKFVKMPDGKILHLDRSGCNNDTEGRDKTKFIGKLYTPEELERFIAKYEGGTCELKIGGKSGKFVTYDDYSKHLRRMLKRATTWDAIKERAAKNFDFQPHVRIQDKVEVFYHDGSTRMYTPEEFSRMFYDIIYGDNVKGYMPYEHNEYDIDKIVSMLDTDRAHNRALFYVA